LEKPKRHPNIGQHRVIIIGNLLRDGGGFIRGPYPKNDVFIFWMGLSQSVYVICMALLLLLLLLTEYIIFVICVVIRWDDVMIAVF